MLVVASVSCIYGLGSPDDYKDMICPVAKGQFLTREVFLARLVEMQYERNDFQLTRGKFRVRGDTIELCPAYTEDAVRVEFFGDEIDRITRFDPISGESEESLEQSHHLCRAALRHARRQDAHRHGHDPRRNWTSASPSWRKQGKLLEAQRLKMRTTFDLEMMEEMGFCNGIENYSRHTSGRPPGSRPYTLIDFFPSDFLTIIDESHVAVPQIGGMYEGDRSRKTVLVEHGFRLPSALDNRPLKFDEFDALVGQRLYVSATPAKYEVEKSGGITAEQVIRPTGLLDPEIVVKPLAGQVDDLHRAGAAARRHGRARARHHADQAHGRGPRRLPARSRREGALHPLRNRHDRARGNPAQPAHRRGRRAHRHQPAARGPRPARGLARRRARRRQGGLPALADLADPDRGPRGAPPQRPRHSLRRHDHRLDQGSSSRISKARREKQLAYNKEHGITPRSVVRAVQESLGNVLKGRQIAANVVGESGADMDVTQVLQELEDEMLAASASMHYEKAALLRDQIMELKQQAGLDKIEPKSKSLPYPKPARGSGRRPAKKL